MYKLKNVDKVSGVQLQCLVLYHNDNNDYIVTIWTIAVWIVRPMAIAMALLSLYLLSFFFSSFFSFFDFWLNLLEPIGHISFSRCN